MESLLKVVLNKIQDPVLLLALGILIGAFFIIKRLLIMIEGQNEQLRKYGENFEGFLRMLEFLVYGKKKKDD